MGSRCLVEARKPAAGSMFPPLPHRLHRQSRHVVMLRLPSHENPSEVQSLEATSAPASPEPTQAPIVYVQATPGGPPASYTLAAGEFPFCIARRFNVDIGELLSINGLTSSSIVSPGQVLKIPQTGNPFVWRARAANPIPTTYKIQSGDTLNTIACSYGDVSPDMIALQNDLTILHRSTRWRSFNHPVRLTMTSTKV